MSYVHNSHAASVWAAHRARQRALRGRAPAKGAGGLAAPTRLKAAAARKDRRAGGPPADSAGPESAAA